MDEDEAQKSAWAAPCALLSPVTVAELGRVELAEKWDALEVEEEEAKTKKDAMVVTQNKIKIN